MAEVKSWLAQRCATKDGLKSVQKWRAYINVAVGMRPRAPPPPEPASIPIPAEANTISSQLHPLMYLINPPPPLGGLYSARHTVRTKPDAVRACTQALRMVQILGITLHALAFGLVVHARQQRDGAHIEPPSRRVSHHEDAATHQALQRTHDVCPRSRHFRCAPCR